MNADFVRLAAGRTESAGRGQHLLGMHFGTPVRANCRIGDRHKRFLQIPGDMGVVPAGTDGTWEDDAAVHLLLISIDPTLLTDVAEQLGKDTRRVQLIPRFQLRDPRMEAIGLAIKADMEDDCSSDPLYLDLLANALAVRMLEVATDRQPHAERLGAPKMTPRQLRRITEFIESNLTRKLSLAELATVAGVSATQLKTTFRNSTGTPVHRYVLGRRIELARHLLTTTSMPASQIALASGFAHQSHMARTMRRILGRTPKELVRALK